MDNITVVAVLNRLYRLCRASELGFNTVAGNISNRGLKLLLKEYAHRRLEIARELKERIVALNGTPDETHGLPARIHRGRINIMGNLAMGQRQVENVVLRETRFGERAINRAYRQAMSKNLPADVKALVNKQFEGIQNTNAQVRSLRGGSDKRTVVRLFNHPQDVEELFDQLRDADFTLNDIQTVDIGEETPVYEGRDSSVGETIISGAVGGGIWGAFIGAVGGIGMLLIPGIEPIGNLSLVGMWAAMGATAVFAGILFGMILGLLIGIGVREEDAYVYEESLETGSTLVLLQTSRKRAPEASQIMRTVNLLARARRRATLANA